MSFFNLNRRKHGYGEPPESSINVFLIGVTLAVVVLVCMLAVILLKSLLSDGSTPPKYQVVPYGGATLPPSPVNQVTPYIAPTFTPLIVTAVPVVPTWTAIPNTAQVRIVPANVNILQPVAELTGHSSPVSSVSFSADSRLMASGDWSGLIQLWNLASGVPIYTFHSASNRVDSVAFSPDGTRLAAAGQDNVVRWWDLSTGKELPALSGPTAAVTSLAFSQDGSLLAAASDDGGVYIWDARNAAPYIKLTGHTSYVTSVTFSPDGKLVAAGGEDDSIRLWSLPGGSPVGVLQGHTAAVASVAFSPDGRSLVSAGNDHMVRLWNLLSLSQTLQLNGHTENVNSAAFSPDGLLVASGAGGIEDNTVRLWDTRSGVQLLTLYPAGPVNVVAFSPDGTRLVAGGATYLAEWGVSATGPQVQAPHVITSTPQVFNPQPQITTTGEPCYLTVHTTSAAVRAGPGADYAVVGQLPLNQDVQSDGWAYDAEQYVWWRLGASGWVRGDAFVDVTDTTLPAACWQLAPISQLPPTPTTPVPTGAAPAVPVASPNQPCVLVTQMDQANVRSGPGTSYPSLAKLAQNQSLQASGWAFDADGFVWWRLNPQSALASGGWIRADTVQFPESCQVLPQVSP